MAALHDNMFHLGLRFRTVHHHVYWRRKKPAIITEVGRNLTIVDWLHVHSPVNLDWGCRKSATTVTSSKYKRKKWRSGACQSLQQQRKIHTWPRDKPDPHKWRSTLLRSQHYLKCGEPALKWWGVWWVGLFSLCTSDCQAMTVVNATNGKTSILKANTSFGCMCV